METVHIYKSHIGDAYWVSEKLEDSELICSVCGGIDEYLGSADTIEKFIEIINSAGARFSMLFERDIENTFGNFLTVENRSGKIFLTTIETKVTEGDIY